MSTVIAKKNELDLVRSIFTPNELTFPNIEPVRDFDRLFTEGENVDCDIDIPLMLKLEFPEVPANVNLSVTLPGGYPLVPPIILLRVDQLQPIVNERLLSNALQEWLTESLVPEEPTICPIVDWLRSALEGGTFLRNYKTECPVADFRSIGVSNPTEVCYWIFSHHIRNPKKRKVIVDWARELYLTGCCLPGKPGIIIVEGANENVEQYWKRIKVLTWKRIQLKDREEISQRRFSDGFFEVGGSLADKVSYLRNHGVSQDRIAAHFGFNP